jgi:hypothetical protein
MRLHYSLSAQRRVQAGTPESKFLCAAWSLTCFQVQVLPRQGRVGPSSDSRLTKQRRQGEANGPRGVADLESPEIELVAGNAQVFDNVGDDAARHVTRMPSQGNQTVGVERVGVVAVAAGGGAHQFAADFTQAAFELSAGPGEVLAHAQAASTNLSRKGTGIGRPVSSNASRWTLAASWNLSSASPRSCP